MHLKKAISHLLGKFTSNVWVKIACLCNVFLSSGSFKMIIWLAEVQLKCVLAGWCLSRKFYLSIHYFLMHHMF